MRIPLSLVVSFLVVGVLIGGYAVVSPGVHAQNASPTVNAASPPDFAGVYYPVQGGRGGAAGAPGAERTGGPGAAGGAPAGRGQRAGGPPPTPTRSAPLADLSQGRAPNAPKLTPEYMAKWEIIRKSRMSGSSEYDASARCIPAGMPSMMAMTYGMEVMQNKDKITMFGELNDQLRRIYLDGRKPSAKVLNDPTYAGYSTGHWEGDTLVVETVALNAKSLMDGASPHSEELTVKERIRLVDPNTLEDRMTMTDPKALLEPYESVRTYRRAAPGNDELREAACAEGLDRAK